MPRPGIHIYMEHGLESQWPLASIRLQPLWVTRKVSPGYCDELSYVGPSTSFLVRIISLLKGLSFGD